MTAQKCCCHFSSCCFPVNLLQLESKRFDFNFFRKPLTVWKISCRLFSPVATLYKFSWSILAFWCQITCINVSLTSFLVCQSSFLSILQFSTLLRSHPRFITYRHNGTWWEAEHIPDNIPTIYPSGRPFFYSLLLRFDTKSHTNIFIPGSPICIQLDWGTDAWCSFFQKIQNMSM